MTSVARRVFEANCKDVQDFYSIHQLSKGQRAVLRKLPVLNKAMVVLITAMGGLLRGLNHRSFASNGGEFIKTRSIANIS
jgi:hypothetical protein